MEIHALQISFTEDDVNALLKKELASHKMVKNVKVRVLPEGLSLIGTVMLLFEVGFESTWTLAVAEGKLVVRLADLKAAGMSANMLRTTLLRLVADAVRKHEGVHIDGDAISVDVDRAASRDGVTAKVNLQAVLATEGVIVIEAGRVAVS